MIEYLEIRSANTREIIGIVDNAKSILWHDVYYGVGDFEIYVPCTVSAVAVLAHGNYVTRYGCKNVGIIENIEITYNARDGRMIVASGRFAKSLLDRRIIYKMSGNVVSPTILSGNVESAARSLVADNAISCAFDAGRNMSELALGASAGITKRIRDDDGYATDKQVTYQNLLEYTDGLLEEYEMGAYCCIDSSGKIAYTVFEGVNRSVDNVDGNSPVIFSQDFDNLLSTDYLRDESTYKNTALIGGEGEGEARFCTMLKSATVTGSARREMFVDASDLTQTYTDNDGNEVTLTADEYSKQLKAEGAQELAEMVITETFDGGLDLSNGSFTFNEDYALGDLVTVQDIDAGLYVNARILETTEVQDENGYQIDAVFGK